MSGVLHYPGGREQGSPHARRDGKAQGRRSDGSGPGEGGPDQLSTDARRRSTDARKTPAHDAGPRSPRAAEVGAGATSTSPGRRAAAGPLPWLALAASALWFVVMRVFEDNVYVGLGPYAVATVVLFFALDRRRLMELLRPSWARVGSGVVVGAAMTLLTYPLFSLAVDIIPALDAMVAELYRSARATPLPTALGWVLVIILAEEILWRGVFVDAFLGRMSVSVTGALGVIVYALAQYGSGSLIVVAVAVACGSIWTAQRFLTGSLLSPLIAHLVWTPTVILLHPVT